MFKYSFEVYWWLLFAYFFMSEQISAFTISHLIERKLYKKRPSHQICIYSNKIISLLGSKQEVWIFYVCLFSLWKSEWSSETVKLSDQSYETRYLCIFLVFLPHFLWFYRWKQALKKWFLILKNSKGMLKVRSFKRILR